MEARTLDYDIRKAVNLGQCKIDDFEQFGHQIQYSVFEIDNSKRIVDNIVPILIAEKLPAEAYILS